MGFRYATGRLFEPRAADRNGLLNNLIAYWSGNEDSGDLIDSHSNNLDLGDTNTVTSADGLVYTKARQYTRGNKEYHTLAHDALLSLGGHIDATWVMWVRADSWEVGVDQFNWLAEKRASNDITTREFAILYSGTSDNLRIGMNVGSDSIIVPATSLGSPSTATWYLVIAWHDSVEDTVNIQVNNGTVDSGSWTYGTQSVDTAPFSIGGVAWSEGLYFDGRIGPTAVWKSAAGAGGVLTAAQRTALYNSGAGLKYSEFTS